MRKDDEGREFVNCRLVARDFKLLQEGPRDELCTGMLPLERPCSHASQEPAEPEVTWENLR